MQVNDLIVTGDARVMGKLYTKDGSVSGGDSGSSGDSGVTYRLSKSGSTITLTGSDGSTSSVTDADTNTTYTLSSLGAAAASHTHSYAATNHTHSYASTSHTHDYAASSHTHSYAASSHTHSYQAPITYTKTSSTSSTTISSGASAQLATMTLTSGTWLVLGRASIRCSSNSTGTFAKISISTSNSFDSTKEAGGALWGGNASTFTCYTFLTITSNTNIYLMGYSANYAATATSKYIDAIKIA